MIVHSRGPTPLGHSQWQHKELLYLLGIGVAFFSLALALYPSWLFLPHFNPDEMYPHRSMWFYDEVVAQLQHIKYQDSRLAAILPGHILFSLFSPITAKILLHLFHYLLALAGLYLCLRLYFERSSALVVCAMFALWDKFLWYQAVLYSASAGVGLLLIATACVGRAVTANSASRRWWLFGAGLLAGLLVHSHAAWGMYGFPLIIVPILIWGLGPRGSVRAVGVALLQAALWVGIGGLSVTLVLGLVSWADGGSFLFFSKSLDVVLNNPYKNASFFKHPDIPLSYADVWWLYLPVFMVFVSLGMAVRSGMARTRGYLPILVIGMLHAVFLAQLIYQWLYTSGNYLSKPDTMVFLLPYSLLILAFCFASTFQQAATWVRIVLCSVFILLTYFDWFSILHLDQAGDWVAQIPELPLLVLIGALLVIRVSLPWVLLVAVAYLVLRLLLPFDLLGYSQGVQWLLPCLLFGVGCFLVYEGRPRGAASGFVLIFVIALLPKPPLDGDQRLFSSLYTLSNLVANSDYSSARLWFDHAAADGRLMSGVVDLLPVQQRHYESFPSFAQTSIFSARDRETGPVSDTVLLVHTGSVQTNWQAAVTKKLDDFGLKYEIAGPALVDQTQTGSGVELVPIKILSEERPPTFAELPAAQKFGLTTKPVVLSLAPIKAEHADNEPLEIKIVLRPSKDNQIPFNGYTPESPAMPLMLGPLVLYATEVENVYRLLIDTTHSERVETRIRLNPNTWNELRLTYTGNEILFRKNDRILVTVEASPVFSTANAMIGGGFLDRRWDGEFVGVTVAIDDPSEPVCFRWLPGDISWDKRASCSLGGKPVSLSN